jgi:nitric oxide synthase oxygenase domain/subunit
MEVQMKKYLVLMVLVFCSLPLFAQARNAVNAKLDSWTVDGEENGMTEKVSNVTITRTNNQMQYYLQVKDGDPIRYEFDRVVKRLKISVKNEQVHSTPLVFAESGTKSSFTYTDKDGNENVLHFSKK